MNTKPNTFMTTMAERYGTGIAARADASGNHQFSTTIADSYAQAGQVVQSALQGAMRELNEITRSESLLANTTPTARMALRGAGYDALGRRQRVAELEKTLMDSSADVRNLGARLDNERSAQEVRALEMTNNMNEDTYTSRRDLTLSTNALQISANQRGITSAQRVEVADLTIQNAMNSGLTLDEMYAVWGSNDPTMMKQIFGTSDRLASHDALTAMTTSMNEQDTARINGMSLAVTTQAVRIASDGEITTEELRAYAGGELELPGGVSMLAIGEALQARSTIEAARVELGTMGVQTEQNSAALTEVALTAMSPLAKLAEIEFAMGMAQGELTDVMTNDPEAAAQIMSEAARLGPITVMTAAGTQVTMSPSAILQSYQTDMVAQRDAATLAIATSTNMRRFMAEERENNRVIETILSMAHGISGETKAAMGVMMQQSSDLYAAAAREQDPVKSAALVTTAQQAAQQARNLAAESLRNTGTPEYIINDILQGRFSSGESVKAAMIDAFGFGASGMRGHPFGSAISALLTDAGITQRDFERWAQDPNASLADLRHEGLLFNGKTIQREDIVGIVTENAGFLVGNVMLDTLMNSPWGDRMPPDVMTLLGPLADGAGDARSSDEHMRRIVGAFTMVEKMIMTEQETAARSGAPLEGPVYQRGSLLKMAQDAVNNSDELNTFLAGSPNGIPSREMAAFLGEFITSVNGAPSFGDGAPAFADIVPTALQALNVSMAQSLSGQSLTDMGRVSLQIQTRARGYGFGASSAGGFANMTSNAPEILAAQKSIEMALMRINTRYLAEPGRHNADSFMGRIARNMMSGASASEIDAELRIMGLDPEVIKSTMRTRS